MILEGRDSQTVAAGMVAVVCLLASACTANSRHHSTKLTASPSPAASTQTISAVRAFVVTASFGSSSAEPATGIIEIAKHTAPSSQRVRLTETILIFPRVTASPQCIQRAELTMTVTRTAGTSIEIAVYPSAAIGFSTGKAPQDPAKLLDNRPRGDLISPATGPISIDVTDLVRAWLTGAFPSTNATVPHRTPMIFTVQPPDFTDGNFSVLAPGITAAGGPALRVELSC